MKIVAFGASTSSTSINKTFASYTASQLRGDDIEILDLRDFEVPMYSTDKEKAEGIPQKIKDFDELLKAADLIIISLAEHNGTYTAVFKNLFDWLSRNRLKMFEDKKVVLISTAPGPRGGKGALDTALERFPRHGANIIGNFTLPLYNENFSLENGIIEQDLKESYGVFIKGLKGALGI